MDTGMIQRLATGYRSLKLIILAAFLYSSLGYALPEGGQVVAGSGSISQQGSAVQIKQNTQNMVINWNSFNTSASEQVNFLQPNSSAMALNRITSGLPTTFAGLLTANGHVWIINPAGVLFTSTSRVDVGGLLVTTLNLRDQDFMNGNYHFQAVPGYMNGAVVNDGEIIARGGNVAGNGLVALMAPGVENNGVIRANLGRVALASGNEITLDLYGDQLIHFATGSQVQQVAVAPDGRVLKDGVANNGIIQANGGQVLLTANAAAKVVENVVSMKGVIEAKTVSQSKNGVIILGGDEGNVLVSGTINSSADKQGNGGSIIIKGHRTVVTGKLEAKGGTESGNGGFIDTSGDYLDINRMQLDVSAPMGISGTWLLDPYNITVIAGNGLDDNAGSPNFTPTGDDSKIGVDLINNQLDSGTNVILDTSGGGLDAGNININAAIIKTTINGASLTLTADNNIVINSPISLVGGSGGGNLNLNALGNLTVNSTLDIGGNVNVALPSFGSSALFNAPVIVGGNLSVLAPNGISQDVLLAPLTVTGTSLLSLGALGLGNITLTNPDNDFIGNLNLTANKFNNVSVKDMNNLLLNGVLTNGATTLTAGGTITQTGSSVIKADVLNLTASGGINLPNANNQINDLIASNSVGGNIIFNNNQNLNVQRIFEINGGNITVSADGNLTVSADGIDTSNGSITLTANGAGKKIFISTDMNAGSGTLTLNSPTVIRTGDTADRTLSSGSIIFNSTLDSDTGMEGLTLDGSATFYDNIGSVMPLKYLTVTGSANIYAGQITTTQAQSYGSITNFLAPAINFTGSTITFLSPVNGNSDITVSGDALFNSLVGFLSPLKSLHVTGDTQLNGSQLKTQNNQTYDGTFVLGANSTLTGGNITFNDVLTLNQNLLLNAGTSGNINFNGVVNGSGFNLTIGTANDVNGNGLMTLANFNQNSGAGSSSFIGGINATNNITINTMLVSGGFFTGNIVTLAGSNGNLGTVNANQLFLGGNNGSDIINTFVNGQGGENAAKASRLLNNANGAFYVNGFLVNPTETPAVVIPPDLTTDITFNTPTFSSVCLGSGCKAAEIVIDNNLRTAAGYVSCMLGFATAVNDNGDERILMPGDAVYADEKVVTDEMSKVTVRYTDGRKVDVSSGQQYRLQPTVEKT